MIWLIDRGSIKHDADDTAYYKGGTLWSFIKLHYYMSRCQAMIYCNRCGTKFKRNQLSIYLAHGSQLKNAEGVYNMKKSQVDYVNLTSKFFLEVSTRYYNHPAEKFIFMGYPRCDYFYTKSRREDISQITSGKYIIWLPTFRLNKNKRSRDDAPGSSYGNIGVPLFYDIESLREFNTFLMDKDIHIIYKPHFVQLTDTLKREKMTNFHIIGDDDILGRNLQLYEVIAQSEALITDYSSVFWDYLLLDRPIAITTDDMKLYDKGKGFAYDMMSIYNETAEIVHEADELRDFVVRLLDGIDTHHEGRIKWRDISNLHQDGKSAERVAEFITEKLGENNR